MNKMKYGLQDVVQRMYNPDTAQLLSTSDEEMSKLDKAVQQAALTGDYSDVRARTGRALRNTIRDVFNTLLDLHRLGQTSITFEEMKRAKDVMNRAMQSSDYAQIVPTFIPLLEKELKSFDEATLKRCQTVALLPKLQNRLLNAVLLMAGLDQEPASPIDSGYYSDTRGGRKKSLKKRRRTKKRQGRKKSRTKKKSKKH